MKGEPYHMSLNYTSLYLTFLPYNRLQYNQSEKDTDLDFCFSDSKCSEEVNEMWSHNPELPDLKKQKLISDHHLETLCCKVCNKEYKHCQSLQRHINKEHPKETRIHILQDRVPRKLL